MYITLNSQFRPFTYDELVKPLQDYGEAYREVEEQYATLAQQTEVWKNIANQENNHDAYEMYKKYSADLNAAIEDFSRGMTIQNRSKLAGLKSRYASEITPIATAANRLKELVDERAKEELKNPSLRYERAVEDINIDKLIKDPFLNYGKSYSGADLEKMVATGALALQKKIEEDPNGWEPILGGQYMQRKLQQGYSIDEVILAALEDPSAPKELTKLLDSALESSGIYDWEGMRDKDGNLTDKGKAVIKEARSFASRGLYNAVGETKYKELSNKAYDYILQKRIKEEEAKNEAIAKYWEDQTTKAEKWKPTNIYSPVERNKDLTNIANNISKYDRYFLPDKNGKYKITEEGKSASKKIKQASYNYATGELMFGDNTSYSNMSYEVSDFGKLMNTLKSKYNTNDDATAWALYKEDYNNMREASYDATQKTEFRIDIDSTSKDQIMDYIIAYSAHSDDIEVVDYDSKKDTYARVDSISKEDLLNNYKVQDIRNSQYGTFAVVIDKTDGSTLRIKIPKTSNIGKETDTIDAATTAYKILQLMSDPNSGLSEEQLTEMNMSYIENINKMYDNTFDLFRTTAIEDDKR